MDHIGLPVDVAPDHVSELDMAVVGRRLRQRARRRAALRGTALCALLVLGGVIVPWGDLDRAPVQLASGAGGGASASAASEPAPSAQERPPTGPTAAGGPSAGPIAAGPSDPARPATRLPATLPPGYERCAGPEPVGAVLRTTFCADGASDLVLDQGPHWALPEVGDPVDVAQRIGYVQRTADGATVTVSDADRDDDTHHALTAADATHTVGELARVLASIPDIRQAAAPR